MEQPNIYYDIIIANPPYGRIGNEITRCIVDNLEWEVYVNLMPANDYRRFNKDNKLYQFVDIRSMKPVVNGFRDAAVTTHMALINKERFRYLSEDAFEIENYTDKSLKKYFYETRKRSHYAIDNAKCPCWHNGPENISNKTVFILGERDISSKRFPVNKNTVTYKWNVEKTAGPEDLHISTNDQLSQIICQFTTEEECKNFTDFCYSNADFMSKVFRAVNTDKMKTMSKVFPKVSWTKPQTVQSILKDYGYTSTEIQEVMDDLKNFRYLSEDEFEIENYTDPQLKKYFYENRKREHYAIDAGKYPCKFEDVKDTVTPQNTFIVHSRDMNHGYIPNKQGPFSVEWNINKKYDINYIHEKYWTMGSGRQSTYAYITFKTEKEKDNFTKFILGDGWDFMCKVLKALNVDGSVAFAKWMPKVCWAKPQTVQSILKDYGYTKPEIDEVMDDLKNFRYMNNE